MKRLSLGDRLTPVLLAACLLCGAVVVLEWYAFSRSNGAAAAPNAQPSPAPAVELSRGAYLKPEFQAFSEILERPLFIEGRTPPESAVSRQTSASATPPPPLAMRLEGVALTPGARIAVVRDIPTNTLVRLAEGDQHQGWVLESVDAASATLKRGERVHQLMLELDKNGKTVPRATSPSGRSGRRVR
jgi:hypothetical protein